MKKPITHPVSFTCILFAAFLTTIFSLQAQTILPAPSGLKATATANNQILLQWTDNSGNLETGFEVEISLNNNVFNKIADVPANTVSYQSTGLNTFTKYWYRVRAKNTTVNSAYSNVAEATTLDVSPVSPTDLTATPVSGNQINLTWKDLSANENGFELQRSVDGTSFVKIIDLPANTTAYQNTGLLPATKYWFRLRAANTVVTSVFSNIASATTSDIVPLAPSALTAVAVSSEQVNLSWTDLSSNETGFQIQRSSDGISFVKVADVAANVTTYENKGLSPVSKYYYRVFAFNTIGNSLFSNIAQITTPQAPVPDVPRDLTAVPLDFDLIQLRWSALSANATEVLIERSKRPDQDFVQIGRQAASVIQFADREILDVADYYYRIRATNAAGSSAYGNVAKVEAFSIITGEEPKSAGDAVYAFDKTLYITLSGPENALLSLYNSLGARQKQVTVKPESQIDLSVLTPGIYIVTIQTSRRLISKKIILF